MKYYSIGDIFRQGILISRTGKPYKDKTSISRALSKYTHRILTTKHGVGRGYTMEQIEDFNKAKNTN